jgi:hypothetical protein
MAAVPIQIDGVMYPQERGSVPRPVKMTILGQASIWGLSVGGGPIVPPPVDPPPIDAHPEHPIVLPPDPPPVLPPDLPDPVPPSTVVKQPPVTGGWALNSTEGGQLYWSYYPGAGAMAPKR